MTEYKLIYGPDPVFSKICEPVVEVDADILKLCDQLKDLLYGENAVGVAAPMIGFLKQVIAIDLQESGESNLMIMINPCITNKSDETQLFEEASICFPGISAKIERPKEITVKFMTPEGTLKSLDADGFLAAVIQHEMDYLKGRTYLDFLSPIKRKMLLKKTKKFRR